MQKCFVLGAPDPEMEEIERVLQENGYAVRYATIRGRRVSAENAYQADGVSSPFARDCQLVFVECGVMGLVPDTVVDHHNPGDPGYGAAPQDYLYASSVGQVLRLLELIPTEAQRIIAAADHCPTAAYQAQCPGVAVEALRAWRTASRAQRRKMTPEAMEAAIEQARVALETAPHIEFRGQRFPWIVGEQGEVSEASARFNLPFMYSLQVRDGRTKVGILGAASEVISAWMEECGLRGVYGDPARGYAGGYC